MGFVHHQITRLKTVERAGEVTNNVSSRVHVEDSIYKHYVTMEALKDDQHCNGNMWSCEKPQALLAASLEPFRLNGQLASQQP